MYLSFDCMEGSGESRTEITTFFGIRYNRNGFAVLSTEHRAHDYLMPMTKEDYDAFVRELQDAIASGAKIVKVTLGEIYRVRRGAILPMEDKLGVGYGVEVIG